MQARADAKDYLDIDALLGAGVTLEDALGAAGAVYGSGFNPLLSLKALTCFGEGDLDALPTAVRDRLATAVASVDPGHLPTFEPRPRLRRSVTASRDAELRAVARKVVWFKPPEETLRDTVFFLNHVMTFGDVDDVVAMRRHFGDEALRDALRRAHPGVFDARSWAYWHAVLCGTPAPPLPTRRIPGVGSATPLPWPFRRGASSRPG